MCYDTFVKENRLLTLKGFLHSYEISLKMFLDIQSPEREFP